MLQLKNEISSLQSTIVEYLAHNTRRIRMRNILTLKKKQDTVLQIKYIKYVKYLEYP